MNKKKRKQQKKNRQQILFDHKKVGTKFIPPLLQIKNMTPSSWYLDRFPELLWLALLSDQIGYRTAIEYAIKLSEIVNSVVNDDKRKCGFYMASDYISLNEDERTRIISQLDDELRKALDLCIGIITKFYPDFPMRWLVSPRWFKETSIGLEGLESIKNTVRTRIDRTSKQAMECQVLAWVMECKSGKVKFPSRMVISDPNLISEYPNTEASKQMAAEVRASIGAFFSMRDVNHDWVKSFWNNSFKISTCEYPKEEHESDAPDTVEIKQILKAGTDFQNKAITELDNLWKQSNIDYSKVKRVGIIGGLLSRNLQFACDITQNPLLWSAPIGPILLRCMAETEIRLKWLIKCGNEEDFKEYIEFGLGQEKLLIEHQKRIAKDDRPDRESILKQVEQREAWLNSQLYTVLIPVDIGSGTQGKDLRDLADQVDLLDLHRLVFSPLSSYVHGQWNAIARLNLLRCINPLHAEHFIPVLSEKIIYYSIAIEAMNFYNHTFRLASEELLGKQMDSIAGASYLVNLTKIVSIINDKADRKS